MKPLHKAYETITALEPLDEDASDGEREAFKATVVEYNKYLGHMVVHMAGVCAASDVTLPSVASGSIVEAPVKILPTPARRLAAILEDRDDDPISATELVAYIHQNGKPPILDAEQSAFVRLVEGYLLIESGEVVRNLFDNERPASDLTLFELSTQAEDIANVTERLHKRDSILRSVTKEGDLRIFLDSLLSSIHAIRFASEWKTISALPGGKLWKIQYRANAFNAQYPDFIADLHTREDYMAKFKRFGARHEKVITARNVILKMYNRFHAAVLLDPLWAPVATYDHATNGRSPTFAGTLNLVVNQNLRESYYLDNQTMLLTVVRELASPSVLSYVEKFLQDFPYTVTA